ncbi:MAG: diguanylate cyclase [Fimbriimonadaceae bacterium]|nr:MAG: diguanylate cyclase [Fimbriimonadaceae bacterium]
MKSAEHPAEADRLAFLKRIQILDTEREQIYDDFVTLAAAICEVPIAMISLVDKERQWFKSKMGVEDQETPRDCSFCTHTILGSEPMIIEDATQDPRVSDSILVTGELHFRFYAGVPVTIHGYPMGALCVVDTEPRNLTKAQETSLVVLARQLSQCLESRLEQMRLEEAKSKQEDEESNLELARRRFEDLFQNMAVACYTTDIEGIVYEFNQQAEELFGCKAWEIFGKVDTDHFVLEEDKSKALELRTKVVRGQSVQGQERKVRALNHEEIWTLFSARPLLNDQRSVTGVINVYHDIAARKKMESELSEMNRALESLASTDALTEIPNRRWISDYLEAQFADEKNTVSIILLDVDNFKSYNDDFGHQAGDQVLRTVGKIIERSCRGGDRVGRYGGEEFIVVLPNTGLREAKIVAERMRSEIENALWEARKVTASFGVASRDQATESLSQLVSVADIRLYSAKDLGRNRVVASATNHVSQVA